MSRSLSLSSESSTSESSFWDEPVGKVSTIIQSDQHPYSKLIMLRQIGALQSVHKEEWPGSIVNRVTITATVDASLVVSEVGEATSLKTAKKKAANTALAALCRHFNIAMSASSSVLSDIEPLSTTKARSGQACQDDAHLKTLVKIYFDGFLDKEVTVGLLSVNVEEFDSHYGQATQIGMAFMPVEGLCSPAKIEMKYLSVRNKQYRGSNRVYPEDEDGSVHGTTVYIPAKDLPGEVYERVVEYRRRVDELILVGHNIEGQLGWLSDMRLYTIIGMERCDVGRVYRAITLPRQHTHLPSVHTITKAFGIKRHDLPHGESEAYCSLYILGSLISAQIAT